MMVAYNVHTSQADDTGYNLGRSKPYRFYVFAANEPSTRTIYKQHSINPVLLS